MAALTLAFFSCSVKVGLASVTPDQRYKMYAAPATSVIAELIGALRLRAVAATIPAMPVIVS